MVIVFCLALESPMEALFISTGVVALAEIGVTLDLLEIRIGKCQLGLFGYKPVSKAVAPAAVLVGEIAPGRWVWTGRPAPCLRWRRFSRP